MKRLVPGVWEARSSRNSGDPVVARSASSASLNASYG
jgi:hypothetical protein